jgi:hypothetical protein
MPAPRRPETGPKRKFDRLQLLLLINLGRRASFARAFIAKKGLQQVGTFFAENSPGNVCLVI